MEFTDLYRLKNLENEGAGFSALESFLRELSLSTEEAERLCKCIMQDEHSCKHCGKSLNEGVCMNDYCGLEY